MGSEMCIRDRYEHMEFKELSPEFADQMKATLSESFRKDPVYGFVFEEE